MTSDPEVLEPNGDPVEIADDPDAVVIFKRTDEEGNVTTAIQALGNVQVTEVQTLIELGLRGFRESLGFKP